jgi:hypothetical protein
MCARDRWAAMKIELSRSGEQYAGGLPAATVPVDGGGDARPAPDRPIVHRWIPEPETFVDEYGDTGIVTRRETHA